jgi:hypothetical protein
MLRDAKNGKLPELIETIDCMVKGMNKLDAVEALIFGAYEDCSPGMAEPSTDSRDAPNPLMGHMLKTAKYNGSLPDLARIRDLIDEASHDLRVWLRVAREAQEGVKGKAGNTPVPDWMVWVARLISKKGYGKREYLKLIEAMNPCRSSSAAWRQRKDDPPKIPWDAYTPLYVYLGGIDEDQEEYRHAIELARRDSSDPSGAHDIADSPGPQVVPGRRASVKTSRRG